MRVGWNDSEGYKSGETRHIRTGRFEFYFVLNEELRPYAMMYVYLVEMSVNIEIYILRNVH